MKKITSAAEPLRLLTPRFTEEEYAALVEKADAEGLSVEEWAHQVIQRALADAEAKRLGEH